MSENGSALVITFSEFEKRVKHEDTLKMLRSLSLERIDFISKRLKDIWLIQNR